MVDQKTTELTEDLTPSLTDLAYGVKDPLGTPLSRKLQWTNILALYDSKTSTLTNKTFDANGTGNSITNIENADIAAGAAIAGSKLNAASTDLSDTAVIALTDQTNNFAASQGINTATPIVPLHVTVSGESRGVTGAHLSNSSYVMVAESADAVVALASQNSGGHGSGIDLMEVDGGALLDKWTLVRGTSSLSSPLRLYYGGSNEYPANTKNLEMTNSGYLSIRSGLKINQDVDSTMVSSALQIVGVTGGGNDVLIEDAVTGDTWGINTGPTFALKNSATVGGTYITRFVINGTTGEFNFGTGNLVNMTDITPVTLNSVAIANYATNSNTLTFTNKTFDANGTGNSLSNVDVADLANGTDGELITWDAAGAPATVPVGTSGHVLTSNGVGAAPTFQASAGANHNLLDGSVHPDTAVSTVVRGDIIIGNATPAWTRLAKGTANQVLTMDGTGTDVTWANSAAGFSDPMTTRGDIIIRNASNVTDRLAIGTNTQVLTSDGTDISWSDATGGGDTVVGTQLLEVDASALYPGGSTPATAIATYQFGAQNQPVRAIKFPDGSNTEAYYQFKLNNWNAGTIKVKAYWFVLNDIATPESTTFELDCSGVALANFDAIGGTAYGTAQTITDTTDSTAAEDKMNISAASASITIAGTPAAGEWLSLKMVRDAATDTAGDVYLAGITIEYTIATGTATI